MAVAVKNASEAVPQTSFDRHRLAVNSLVGALYVLGSIGLVFYAIPEVWWKVLFPAAGENASFVMVALQLVAMVAAAGGLAYLGMRLLGQRAETGLRAGVFLGCVGLLAVAYATWLVGKILETTVFGDPSKWTVGIIVTLLIGGALLFLLSRFFFRPSFEEAAVALEEQGWFTAAGYKRSQGQRVRRGTLLGILILAGCGIYTLISHQTMVSGSQDWTWLVPFSDQQVTLLRDLRFSVPLILSAAALWIAYRVVNFPAFADFLIATEAEVNKVSWTTRKRLVQDTIVVLTTVILFTVFLFFVDILWGFLLTRVGVIRSDPNQPGPAQTEESQPW